MRNRPSKIIGVFTIVLAVQLFPMVGRTCYGQQSVSIVYSGDVRGYIDPCG